MREIETKLKPHPPCKLSSYNNSTDQHLGKMSIKALLVGLVLAIGVAYAMPTEQSACVKLLTEHGFSSNFNETIAHAIHSITVQGLQKFNSRATEKNSVPTVNMDRHSDVPERVVEDDEDVRQDHEQHRQGQRRPGSDVVPA